MSWSKEQLAAIQTYDKNILVAAAAGSGKTSVLVERIISRVLDETQDFSVDKVLVVTFTKAAAAEMRQRISNALEKKLVEQPHSQHLKRQQILLNNAAITTIDSFCQTIVKQNFHRLDLDPKFRVAVEGELTLLKYEVMENIFENKYANLREASEFALFIDHYGKQIGDEALYTMLFNIYTFSRSNPQPTEWLDGLAANFAIADEAAAWQSAWGMILRENALAELARCTTLINNSIELAQAALFTAYDKTLASDKGYINEFCAAMAQSWSAVDTCLAKNSFVRLARAPKDAEETLIAELKQNREQYKAIINELRERYFYADFSVLQAEFTAVRPVVAAIVSLVKEFANDYRAAKQARGIVDFNDLEHFCLSLLRDEEAGKFVPSAIATALQAKYQEVMIDEYQDTNGLQEAILQLIRRDSSANLFMVGDVKQSIYRFRLAEPELFNQKYQTYPMRGNLYRLIRLANNYRSRPAVIAAVNFVFSQVMTKSATELDYHGAELIANANYPVEQGKTFNEAVEMQLIDCAVDELSETDEPENIAGFALESELMARRIEQLMHEGYQVYDKDKGGYRPLMLRDIVILLRAVKGKSEVVLETLKRHNIPAYAELAAGYFAALEIQIMLALLAIIDNPHQDIELAAVLYSPIINLSTEELALVRLADDKVDLYDAVIRYSQDHTDKLATKLDDFTRKLIKWRELAMYKSVPDLIWQLFNDTGYYDYVGSMEGGLLRQANLRMLYDRAGEYEATNYRGLFRFLRFIEKMRAKETDLSVARTLSDSENVVRVMSIHKSKGLEFPVVFIADIGKQFNMQDKAALMLLHKKLGLGASITTGGTEPDSRLRYPGVIRNVIGKQLEKESKAEELRVLYVAMTRAREKLILIGSTKKLVLKAAGWCNTLTTKTVELPDEAILGAKSYLDWLGMAIVRHENGKVLREYSSYTGYVENPLWQDCAKWEIAITKASELKLADGFSDGDGSVLLNKIRQHELLASSADKPAVEEILNWQYHYQDAVDKPAKLSVTEMKRRFDNSSDLVSLATSISENQVSRERTFARPRFKQDANNINGSEYGTLMHNVMQHLDLSVAPNQLAIQQELNRLVMSEIILAEQLSQINRYSLISFLQSDLAERMRNASRLWRELPFSMMLPANEIYPDMKSPGEEIFVQGVIDVLFAEGNNLILLDYKTDKATTLDILKKRHTFQIDLYTRAVEKIYKQPITEKYLYLFSLGQYLKL